MVFEQDLAFERRMRPAVEHIFQQLFPECEVVYTREDSDLQQLDNFFAVDTILTLPSGQIITAQQKCRRHRYLEFGDFTQEYMNAAGTEHETPGEWFRLAAQLYFYGWANPNEDGFAAWVILDVIQYKMLVEREGGLEQIGQLNWNVERGRANFYAIPVDTLRPTFVGSHGI